MSTAVMQLTEVGLTYPGPPPVTALRDVNLTLNDGEFVSIMGPSGSGKSTLMNILGLLEPPTVGRYVLSGRDTSNLSDAETTALRANLLGFVFQSFHLMMHRTVLENVQLSLLYKDLDPAQRPARATAALAEVGLANRADARPNQLSGGERQRVAFARALASKPSVLLCDEPTGNLDSTNTDAVLALLRDLNERGHTIIVITHDPRVGRCARRHLRITDGRLSEQS